MNNLQVFKDKISKLIKDINAIEADFFDLYKEYEGNEFDGQNKIVGAVDNAVLVLTHETSTQIGFGLAYLELLDKFFHFRKKYSTFTDSEISSLIDDPLLSIKKKRDIYKDKDLEEIKKIPSDWNRQFNNVGYEKVKKKLRII